jgi:RNA polymerase sigma-70 factor, ECF subfamily
MLTGQRPGAAGEVASVPGAMPPLDAARPQSPRLDPASQAWIARLDPHSRERDAAIAELHALLLRAARFEVARRWRTHPHLRGNDLDDVAHQSADDALLAVLGKLGDFRGESRFTTWAYKFALLEAAVKVRRRAWQGREVPLEPESWAVMAELRATPHDDAEAGELFAAVREAIKRDLSPHQREVLLAVTVGDVPIDVLAERLNTTRGALYKTIHDARRKLRTALAARGLGAGDDSETTLR